MTDEERRHNRSEEADANHAEGQSPQSQRQGYTQVRLAGFPVPPVEPRPYPEEETSEDERTSYTGDDLSNEDLSNEDLSNEPRSSPLTERSDGGLHNETASNQSEKERTGGDGQRSGHEPGSSRGQQQANASPRGSGPRLVVPASTGQDGAPAPQQQGSELQQPALEDDTSESADTTDSRDQTGLSSNTAPSNTDKTKGEDAPADADGVALSSASETPGAQKQKEERSRRSSAAHQQAIAGSGVGLAPPGDRSGRGQGSETSGTAEASLSPGQQRSETEPPPRQRTAAARGYSRIPWQALAKAAAVILVLGAAAAGVFALWPAPVQPGSDATEQPQAQEGAANAGQAGGSEPAAVQETGVRETGVAFEELSVEGADGDGSGEGGSGSGGDGEPEEGVDVSLRAAVGGGEDLVWTGTASGPYGDGERSLKDSPESARSISLSGDSSPTSANFQAGFEMPTAPGGEGDGEVQSGVMARTEPGEPVTHATYQRLAPAGGAGEGEGVHAQGSYYVADDEGVIAGGSYKDRREDSSREVVRTYTEDNPATGGERTYRVAFEAPTDTPIPTLVGWQPPEDET